MRHSITTQAADGKAMTFDQLHALVRDVDARTRDAGRKSAIVKARVSMRGTIKSITVEVET